MIIGSVSKVGNSLRRPPEAHLLGANILSALHAVTCISSPPGPQRFPDTAERVNGVAPRNNAGRLFFTRSPIQSAFNPFLRQDQNTSNHPVTSISHPVPIVRNTAKK